MSFFEVVAILGALAWLPQIFKMINEKLKKPKIKIISDDQLELGYTRLGPIININFAFLSENKSALVNKIDLQIIHESNEMQTFTWIWYEESLFQMDMPKIPISYKKNQKAIALNISENLLVEKRIGFQNVKFKQESSELINNINEDTVNLKSSGKELNELKSYSSYINAVDYLQNSFYWKNGLYTAKFTVHVSGLKEKYEHSFKFSLTKIDVKTIHKNIEACLSYLEKVYIKVDEELNEKWEWVYINKLSEAEEIRIKQKND
jgi:hypothetical protein